MSILVNEILSAPDSLEALRRCRMAKKAEVDKCEAILVDKVHKAFAPLPKANNRMELVMNTAMSAFNIFQGIRIGIRIVRGFKSVFSGRRRNE